MSYYEKYLKYKNKYLYLQNKIMKGGLLDIDETYANITSFGFEFEFREIMPFTGIEDLHSKILTLTPFGYDENSLDNRENRSINKFELENIEENDLIGNLVLTQDSYVIFDSDESNRTNLKEMYEMEALTKRLDKSSEIFTLNDASEGLNYDKIKFNVNENQNLTIGDTEFVCTFKHVNTDIFNINTCTHKIIDRLKIYLSTDSNFIGKISISYKHYFYEDEVIKSIDKYEDYDLFKINFNLHTDINTYMLVNSSIIHNKKNMYDYLLCAPQITLGVPIKNIKDVILKMSKFYDYSYNINNANKLAEILVEETLRKLKDTEENDKLELINKNSVNLLNYLFFYYLYVDCDYMKDYTFKNKDITTGNLNIEKYFKMGQDLTETKYLTIPKYAKSYLPRQHFHEILENTPDLLDCVKIVYNTNFNFILLNRIYYLRWIISKKKIKMPTLHYLSNTSIDIEPNFYENYYGLNPDIMNQFDSFVKSEFHKTDGFDGFDGFDEYDEYDDDIIKYIASILICDMKMFTGIKNGGNDQITSFTTRIPYDGHNILFEYRTLTRKTDNMLHKAYKMNKYNTAITLNNIEFVLNKYKSNFLYNHLPIDTQVVYDKLKIDRNQEFKQFFARY
jgi:hypothetical protein